MLLEVVVVHMVPRLVSHLALVVAICLPNQTGHMLVLAMEVDFLVEVQQHYKILDLVEVDQKEHQGLLTLKLILVMVDLVLSSLHIPPK